MGSSKERQKIVVKAEDATLADIKGKIVEYSWWLKKQGCAESTIVSRARLLNILIKRGANLSDQESVKEVIAKQSWSEGRKNNAVVAYTTFLHMKGESWDTPRYRQEEKLPFAPLEIEIDQLISGCSLKVSCFLQTLKETAMRPGEAWRLTWESIDIEKNNNP